MITLKQILVPTDFSSTAAKALKYAKALAEAFGATLHILHVVEDPLLSAMSTEKYMPPAEFYETLEANGRKALDKVLSAADREKFHATMLLARGSTADQIVNYAKDRRIDLIVMGTHGRRLLARLLLGSVADKVLRRAHCPVMTIHSTEHG